MSKRNAQPSQIIDMVGYKSGKLTVLSFSHLKRRSAYWKCICECGKEVIVWGSHLRSNRTTSCGCRRAEAMRDVAKSNLSTEPRLVSARNIYGGKSCKKRKYGDGDITFDQFLTLSQLPCFYCLRPPKESNLYNRYRQKREITLLEDISLGDFYYNGLDRLDSSKPHNLDNVVPCCKHCNKAKLDKMPTEFQEWLKQTAAHHLYEMKPNELDEAVALWKAQKEKDSSCLESSSELALVS